MILRRWVTENSPFSVSHLRSATSKLLAYDTRKRPPYHGFVQVWFWEVSPDTYRVTRQGLRMLWGAFRGGNPLERIVGYARKCQLVSTPEIPACGKCRITFPHEWLAI